jgi:hypothetical protein
MNVDMARDKRAWNAETEGAAGVTPAAPDGVAPNGAAPADAAAGSDGGQQTGAGARGTGQGTLLQPPARNVGGDGAQNAGKGADGEGEKQAEAPVDPLDTVPEDGKYVLELPEGMVIDEALAAEAFPMFKEVGLTRRQANRLATFFGEVRAKEAAEREAAWQRVNENWQKAAKADAEYAEVGFDRAVAIANSAIAKFGTTEFDAAIVQNGWGNHPEMIRFLYRVGRALADDVSERGRGGGTEAIPLEQRMYGATTPATKRN